MDFFVQGPNTDSTNKPARTQGWAEPPYYLVSMVTVRSSGVIVLFKHLNFM